jgi:hypothetical protein
MLTKNFELNEHKQKVATVYNLAADGYDKPALRFFPLVAERLVDWRACAKEIAYWMPGPAPESQPSLPPNELAGSEK